MLKKAPQMGSRWPSWPQLGLKMAILAPTWGILAPSWLQLGPILAQFGEISADPSPAKIDVLFTLRHVLFTLRHGRPQELPDPLQTLIFQVFGTIFKTFSLISKAPFYRFCFLHKGPEGRGGGGTRPQGVFDSSVRSKFS